MHLMMNSGLSDAQIKNYYTVIKNMFEVEKFKSYALEPVDEEVPAFHKPIIQKKQAEDKKRDTKFTRKTLHKKKPKEESVARWGPFQTAGSFQKDENTEDERSEDKDDVDEEKPKEKAKPVSTKSKKRAKLSDEDTALHKAKIEDLTEMLLKIEKIKKTNTPKDLLS